MPTPENDPAVGDPVILRGRILKIDAGVALVEVYRSYPAGWTVAVQCGALELDETPASAGEEAGPSEEDKIRLLTRAGMENPGKVASIGPDGKVILSPAGDL